MEKHQWLIQTYLLFVVIILVTDFWMVYMASQLNTKLPNKLLIMAKFFYFVLLFWLIHILPVVSLNDDKNPNSSLEMVNYPEFILVLPNNGFFSGEIQKIQENIEKELGGLLLSEVSVIKKNNLLLQKLGCSDGYFKTFVIYVAHPADPRFYISVANFHSYLLQDKFAEFINLTTSLGAKEITLVNLNNLKSTIKGGVSLNPLIDLHVESNNNVQTSVKVFAKFSEPSLPPKIPNKLKWYIQEPLWQAMSLARINNGVEEFKIRFTYLQDYGINSELVSNLASSHLKIGGRFSGFNEINQEFNVKFFSQQEYSISDKPYYSNASSK